MNNKPRVLFIMHMPPPVHGASMVGKYIYDSELVNSEFECLYLNPTTAKNLEDVNKLRLEKIFDVFGLIKRIKVMVCETKPDVVYFTANAAGMPFYKDWLIVQTLKKVSKVLQKYGFKKFQIVVHYHNKGVSIRQDLFVDNLLYRCFFKDLKIILLADNLYSDIQKYVKRVDVQICGNGIPDLCVVQNNKTIEHCKPLNILYLSNMITEKGVWTLVDACRLLKDRSVMFHCVFVGGWKDITEKSFNANIEKHGLRNFISAYGPKYGEEKETFFRQADVMAFPTYYHNECFPLVLLEGMMHGLACVSTREAGIPEIIVEGTTGFMVKSKDADALADALQKLAENRELCCEMGMNGRKKYETEFTLPVFERNITKCIKNIILD